jgi:hypothetical protein
MENNNVEEEKGAQEKILRLEYPKPEDQPKPEENPNKPEDKPKPVVEETNRVIQEGNQKEHKEQHAQKEKVKKCSRKVVGTTTLSDNYKVSNKAVKINWSHLLHHSSFLKENNFIFFRKNYPKLWDSVEPNQVSKN